jgi:hypothetical protein
MNIVEIKLAGQMTKQNAPTYFATIHKVPGNDHFTVTIFGPDGDREHIVEADSPEDVYSMAECLQYHLDGCKGTNSMIHDYYRILQHFTTF